ncbi:MAG TPA: 3-oxoacyl-ACP reductase family protein [bacterium]|nr:3-oxoacyl-ACP reductase family protein [bacterium]
MTLAGKIALVTGASRGIGADVALALAEAGADVVCAATSVANAEPVAERVRTLGRRALALAARVEDAAEVAALFERAEAELGPVHLLVNNAGIAQPKPILEMDEAIWDRVVDINLKGVFLCAQRAARTMRDQGGGVIVNIGSIAGENAFPNRANYCASKAAVHHLTRVMAIEWAALGIRVNCVAPGYIRTEMIDELAQRGILDTAKLEGRVPQRRLGMGRDIADAVLYLAGEGAQYVTGTVLTVDGGWDAYGYV